MGRDVPFDMCTVKTDVFLVLRAFYLSMTLASEFLVPFMSMVVTEIMNKKAKKYLSP